MSSSTVSSLNALAHWLNVATSTVQKWEQLPGFPCKTEDGFDVNAVASWVVDNPAIKKALREKVAVSTGLEISLKQDELEDEFNSLTGSPNLERYRKARAEQEELKLAIQKNELVKLDDYIQAEAARYGVFKRNLEQLIYTLPARIENLNQDEIMKELQSSFDELLKVVQRSIE